jgi:hypothetical protein
MYSSCAGWSPRPQHLADPWITTVSTWCGYWANLSRRTTALWKIIHRLCGAHGHETLPPVAHYLYIVERSLLSWGCWRGRSRHEARENCVMTSFIICTFRDIGFSDFIHRPGIKKQTKETRRFGNWICFRPQVRERLILLGPLERASLNHWITVCRVSLVCFLIPGRWIKSGNPISLKVIHHRQNNLYCSRNTAIVRKSRAMWRWGM